MATASVAIAVLEISFSIALAALIFTGPLDVALPTAAGAFILSGALASMIVGWRSSSVGVFGGTQDTAGVVVATVVGPATLALSAEAQAVTALVIVAVSTLVIGVAFLLLGRLRLGGAVRYLPQPVVGGFLAGTGWLMLKGGAEVMVNRVITPSTLLDALHWDEFQFIIPGCVLALYIVIAVAQGFPPLAMSLGVVSAAATFYVGVALLSSVQAAEDGGWLIGPFSSKAQWDPITPGDLAAVDWPTVISQTPAFAAIAIIAVVGLLLNLAALEAVSGEDIDVNQELKVAGTVNILAGGLGGLGAWHRVSSTVLAQHLEARNRIIPVIVGAFGIVIMIGGSRIVELVPRAVAGGVIAGLGLALLWCWALDYIVGSDAADKLLGFGVLAGIAILGPLMGVALGVIGAATLFVIQYGKIDPVRHQSSWGATNSTDETQILILAGYLFFGSATKAVHSLSRQAMTERKTPLRTLIVDTSGVIGIDVSAATCIAATVNRLIEQGVSVTISGANRQVTRAMKARKVDDYLRWTDSLEKAVDLNEKRLVADLDLTDNASLIQPGRGRRLEVPQDKPSTHPAAQPTPRQRTHYRPTLTAKS